MKTLETETSDKYLTGYAQTTKPAVTFSPFLEALEAKAGAHAEPYTPLPKSSAGNITSGDPITQIHETLGLFTNGSLRSN